MEAVEQFPPVPVDPHWDSWNCSSPALPGQTWTISRWLRFHLESDEAALTAVRSVQEHRRQMLKTARIVPS